MEKIFDVNNASDHDGGHGSGKADNDEDKGFKFWVDVDICRVEEK